MLFNRLSLLFSLSILGTAPLVAAEKIEVIHAGKTISVEKNAGIMPLSIGDGVATVGEAEVLSFMENDLRQGAGLILDNRAPELFAAMTIPGAVNIPAVILEKGLDSPHVVNIIKLLGASAQGSTWNFDNARKLLLFGNSALTKESFNSAKKLQEMGYPGEKILWYRGGLNAWSSMRLMTIGRDKTVSPAVATSDASTNAQTQTADSSTAASTDTLSATTTQDTEAAALPETVIVGANESLSDVAKRVYGEEKRFFDLYNANKDRIKDMNVVHEGQELVIPRP